MVARTTRFQRRTAKQTGKNRMAPSKPESIKSVVDFISAIKHWDTGRDQSMTPIFRGQTNKSWDVQPGILRPGRAKFLENERNAVRDLLSIHPQEFQHDSSMFDKLVTMQHFGLPTRLLDVTSNPLVALYFSSAPSEIEVDGRVDIYAVPPARVKYFDSDAVSCVANLSNLSSTEKEQIRTSFGVPQSKFNALPVVDRLLQFIRIEKPYFRPEILAIDLFRPYYVIPKMSNRRIIAQNGSFLLFGLEQPPETNIPKDIKGATIPIDKNAKSDIRKELGLLGIKESSLFPEIDRAAIFVAERYSD